MKSIQAATYLVHFQEQAYLELNTLIAQKKYSTLFILVDENTFEHCYSKFIPNLDTDKTIEVIEIESGEINKSIETCVGVWNAITELGGDRKSLLITLGGGVITDLGGFVASTFKRGIDFVNIPTTLLSMVDASVGGKTGVDLGVLKNQIGLFSNPEMVLIDTEYLTTVTDREMKSGMAEIIKYGLTYDLKLFNHIKEHKKQNINDLIFRSIEIKNEIVLQDPTEKNLRKVLNFGHTVGHAIESFYLESEDKENFTHGEAIAIGMVCESYISTKLLGFSNQKLSEVKETITAIYGKTTLLTEDYPAIMDLLKHDKKNVNGQVNFVLLNDFENHQLDCKVSEELIVESLDFYNA
ncbi:3-dehydroquinate synthase [Polaribacter sp.]|nr:3-dehydroquinate synthase [Polaribacter sp.]MDA9362628.1 3-dehydroquinate synthase [Polaribacter sp.]MDC1354964.1 3-dehydroquinate synthase [Polaribacter sp.]MDC1462528.1 3-dehydroquinate synthase [Polaribacter sp.]MDC1515535.1 3-dehydroquinate synthase [Polaribacter sp.]